MEELRLLAREYYQNTVRLRFFGIKGGLCLLLSVPFLVFSFYLNFHTSMKNLTIIPMFVGAGLWMYARVMYDRKLIVHLSFFTHLDSKRVRDHKAVYLQYLTSHVGSSLFSVMKSFNEILDVHSRNKSFVLDNGWRHFITFLYDPESKNRILSLVIYFISLIALLTVARPGAGVSIYELIASISTEQLREGLFWLVFVIILGYVLVLVPLMFFVTYIFVPLLLKFSSSAMLSKHFMSELNKYAFLEQRSRS